MITIDDGFYSVLSVAARHLLQQHFPATVYVTSYYVEKGTPVFRLLVQYLFWKTDKSTLHLGDVPWTAYRQVDLHNAAESDAIMWDCIRYGEQHCSETERNELSRQLCRLSDMDYHAIVDSRGLSLLSAEEIQCLQVQGFDIQLHTHRHHFPIDNEQQAVTEIEQNRHVLEAITGNTLTHFCYPSDIWDKAQWPWLARLGVESATTCQPGFNDKSTPPLALYRFLDGEHISDIEFKAEVYGFLEVLRGMFKSAKR